MKFQEKPIKSRSPSWLRSRPYLGLMENLDSDKTSSDREAGGDKGQKKKFPAANFSARLIVGDRGFTFFPAFFCLFALATRRRV